MRTIRVLAEAPPVLDALWSALGGMPRGPAGAELRWILHASSRALADVAERCDEDMLATMAALADGVSPTRRALAELEEIAAAVLA